MSDQEKVNAHLKAIEEYVVGPIQHNSVGEHCIASLSCPHQQRYSENRDPHRS